MTANTTSSKGTPGYAKLVMLLQTFVILFLSFWLYEQYLNDIYFQAYLNGALQDNGLLLVIGASIGIFAIIGTGFYLRLRGTRSSLEMIVSTRDRTNTAKETVSQPSKTGTGITVLEPHVEKELIEMLRKNTPADVGSQPGPSSSMPVLKRDQNPASGQSPQA